MSPAMERLLSLLSDAREIRSGSWVALCPVHSDRHPSLSIDEGAACVLVVCRSCGANGADVCEVLGLPPGALFDDWGENRASRPRRPVAKKPTTISEALLAAADEAGDDGLRVAVGIMADGVRERLRKRRC